jgi:hypothetical protein
VKARLDSNVQCIDIRIGSDDEGGLTKAINNVFPNAARLLCSKHIKNNVTDHIKNKLSITKDQRSDIMSTLFGDNGIINADDTTDIDVRFENLCSSFPVFAEYFNSKLKTRMLEHVIRPSRQRTNTRLWTNNNCERMNHRFKISTDWKPQRLLELVNTIHDIVRLHFADLKKALFRQGSYELECAFQHLYVPHTVWTSKTTTENENICMDLFCWFISSFLFKVFYIKCRNNKSIINEDIFFL